MPAAPLEYSPCDLCGSERSRPYLAVHDRMYGLPGEFQLVECQGCRLLYINPRPNRASIAAFYPDLDYHAFRPAQGLKGHVARWLRRREAKSALHGLPAGARALEIGCATGDLLVALRSQGANVTGVEPNDAAARVARTEHGLDVRTGLLDEVSLPLASFDLVLMKYSLEHVHSPRATLQRIQQLLKPSGRAVLWVPNVASMDARLFGARWRGLDAPRHLYLFTPETMRRLVEAVGMRMDGVTFSPAPNEWAGSTELWLRERDVPDSVARRFGVESPAAMLAWLPISAAAAALHFAGRMQVVAVNEPR